MSWLEEHTWLARLIDGFSKDDIIKKDEKIVISPEQTITYSVIRSHLKYDVFTSWPIRKRIVIAEGVLKKLNKQELKSILLHEQGHLLLNAKFTLFRFIASVIFTILIFFILAILRIIWLFPLVFLLVIISYVYSYQILEVLCDVYAIKKSDKNVFLSTLKKYNEMQTFNPKNSGFGKFWHSLTHPTYIQRVKLINFFLRYDLLRFFIRA